MKRQAKIKPKRLLKFEQLNSFQILTEMNVRIL